jgi:hypothetical protein
VRTLSVFALVAAGFGALIAYGTYWASCLSESGGSTMCPMNEPTNTMQAQLVLGIVGVIPALLLVLFAFRGRRTPAKAALLIGLVMWAVWGVLNDASVHGWSDDMWFQ